MLLPHSTDYKIGPWTEKLLWVQSNMLGKKGEFVCVVRCFIQTGVKLVARYDGLRCLQTLVNLWSSKQACQLVGCLSGRWNGSDRHLDGMRDSQVRSEILQFLVVEISTLVKIITVVNYSGGFIFKCPWTEMLIGLLDNNFKNNWQIVFLWNPSMDSINIFSMMASIWKLQTLSCFVLAIV